MIRVVLDTNILISALLSPQGPPAQVFLMTILDFLECAQAAAAHFLVTGNAKDFPAAWSSTQIVTSRQFLDAVV
jgi:predicted nucleic acid-binding protein